MFTAGPAEPMLTVGGNTYPLSSFTTNVSPPSADPSYRLQRLIDARTRVEAEAQRTEDSLRELRQALNRETQAAEALMALAEQRKTAVASILSHAATSGVQQVFGDHLSVQLGRPEASGNKAFSDVLLTCPTGSDDLRQGGAESMLSLVDMCLWADILRALGTTQRVAQIGMFDEPFLALRPERFPLCAAIFEACVEAGIQLIVVTNQEGMIPDGAQVVRLTGSMGNLTT